MTPTTLVLDALKRIPGEARFSEIWSFTKLDAFECLDTLDALEVQGKVTYRMDVQDRVWWRLVEER